MFQVRVRIVWAPAARRAHTVARITTPSVRPFSRVYQHQAEVTQTYVHPQSRYDLPPLVNLELSALYRYDAVS